MPLRARKDPQRRRRRPPRDGKTSLVEALLFQAGSRQPARRGRAGHDGLRLGRGRAAAADVALAPRSSHCEWQGRKINLDRHARATPASRRDALAALRVVEGALVVVNGVMGVEVSTARAVGSAPRSSTSRASSSSTCSTASAPTSSACSGAAARSSRTAASPSQIPIGAEHELTGHRRPAPHEGLHEPGRQGARSAASDDPGRASPTSPQEYREKLLDAVVETDEALMERYLEGEEISARGGRRGAQGRGHARRGLPGRAAASRPRTSARPRCSTCSSRASRRPAKKGDADGGRAARAPAVVRLQDDGRPVRRADQLLPRLKGTVTADATLVEHPRARQGAARLAADRSRARSTRQADGFGEGDIGAVAKLKETMHRRSPARQGGARSSRRASTSPSR